MGFRFVIAFIDHLRIVTTSNYNSLTELDTPNIAVNYSTHKVFPVITSRFLVAGFNTVCLRPYHLAHILQSQSHVATNGQSISKSWCQVPSGAHDQIFMAF
jgi:hypothetical protein